jgi:hypothetical protein
LLDDFKIDLEVVAGVVVVGVLAVEQIIEYGAGVT